MNPFPRQRIPLSKKNKAWREDCVNYLCGMANSRDLADYERMQENYNFNNGVIDQEDYQSYVDPLGLDAGKGRDFIHSFNKTHNKIQVLKGEELHRPWNFNVIDQSPSASNEVIREKSRQVQKYLEFQVKKEISMASQRIQLEAQQAMGEITSPEMEKQYNDLVAQMMEKEKQVADPEAIEKKFKKYRTAKEKLYGKLMSHYKHALKLKHIKNEGFFDMTITGIEAVHLTTINGEPFLEIVNPLGLTYYKSPEKQLMHKGDYIIYEKEITLGEALDTYGNELSKKDSDDLEKRLELIDGMRDKMASPDGESSSHWDQQNEKALRTSIENFRGEHSGGYGQSNSNDEFIKVYICYWKSWQRIGFLSYPDEAGNMITVKVSEEFVMPADYQSRKVDKQTEFFWTDANGIPYTLVWQYVPQVWQGTRLENDKYCAIEPYKNSIFSEDRPFECHLPIYGVVINNRNAPIAAPMDRMKPWQRLYLVVMAKWLKLIAQDKGVIQFVNELMIDPKVGIEKAMAYAAELGWLPVNPLAHAEGGNTMVGMMQNMQPTAAVNLSNAAQLTHYTDILRFLEEELGDAASISKQREGQTAKGTNVTDNRQDIIASTVMTEPLFAVHDLLWEDVLNGIIKLVEKMIRRGELSHIKRYFLSDDEIASLEVSPEDGECDMGIVIANNSLANQVLEQAKSFANELIQNDKTTYSGLIELLSAQDLQEFKSQIRDIEISIEERAAATAQQQQEHEARLMEMQKEITEDEQAHEVDIQAMKDAAAMEREYIKALGMATAGTGDNDLNDNGAPDALEVEKFRSESRRKDKELDLKFKEAAENQTKRKEELQLKKEDQKIKREKLKIDAKKAAQRPKKA